MKLGTDSLEAFYEVARSGAQRAAGRLTRLTRLETHVVGTDCVFVQGTDLDALLADAGSVGVCSRLTDGLPGDSLVTAPRDSAEAFSTTMGSVRSGIDEDAIAEVGGILNNGFINRWADVVGTGIDVSPPLVVTGGPEAYLDALDAAPTSDEFGLVFHSRLRTEAGGVLDHFLFLRRGALSALTSQAGGVDAATFAEFDRMTRSGGASIADTVETMTRMETRVERRRGRFAPLKAVPERFADDRYYCVAFEFGGVVLSGYLAFLFDEPSARTVVERTGAGPSAGGDDAPDSDDSTGSLGPMGVSALEELGNITASDLLDSWTDALGETISHSAPAFGHDFGWAVVDPLLVRLSETGTHTYAFDVQVTAPAHDFECTALAMPDGATLQAALRRRESAGTAPEVRPAVE